MFDPSISRTERNYDPANLYKANTLIAFTPADVNFGTKEEISEEFIQENVKLVESQLEGLPVSNKTVVSVCHFVLRHTFMHPIFIKRGKRSVFGLDVDNSVTIIRSPKDIHAYIALKGDEFLIFENSKQKVTEVVRLVFKRGERIELLSVDLVAKLRSKLYDPLVGEDSNNYMRKRAYRRISIMQALDKAPFFPENFHYIEYAGFCEKLASFQTLASCDLFELIINKREFLSPINRISLCESAIKALQYVHAYGFIHRDIKPENFLIYFTKTDGIVELQLKLTDFDLSCHKADDTLSTACGSFPWCSPEVIHLMLHERKNPFEITLESDIYSLGLIFESMEIAEFPEQSRYLNIYSKLKEDIAELKLTLDADDNVFEATKKKLQTILIDDEEINTLQLLLDDLKLKCEENEEMVDLLSNEQEIQLQKWNDFIKNYPSSPEKISSFKDLTISMLQVLPSRRISLQKALKILHRLKSHLSLFS